MSKFPFPLFFQAFVLLLVTVLPPLSAQTISEAPAPDLILGDFTRGAPDPEDIRALVEDPVSGKVFISDRNRILRFSSSARFTPGTPPEAVFSLFVPPLSGEGGLYNRLSPSGLALDPAGNLWVCTGNAVVRYNNALMRTETQTADTILGQADFTTDTAAAGEWGLNAPVALAVDPSGCLWVADAGNNRVVGFSSAATKESGAAADKLLGQPTWTNTGSGTAPTRMTAPFSLAADAAGNLWTAELGRVLRFNNAASKPVGAAADGVLGHTDFFGTPPGDPAAALDVKGIASGPDDRLWVLSGPQNRVLRFENASSKSGAAIPDGLFLFNSFDEFRDETLAAGAGDSLWVLEEVRNNFVQGGVALRYQSASGKTGAAVAEGVLGDYTTEPVDARRLSNPVAVVQDAASGKVFVVDRGNHRVLRFASADSLNSGAAAEAVFGQPNFSGPPDFRSPEYAASGGLVSPSGCVLDKNGNLWVSDSGHNRVLRYGNAVYSPAGTAPAAVLGQPNLTATALRPASEHSIRKPGPLAMDAAGRLYVTEQDEASFKVLRFDQPAAAASGAPASGELGRVDFYDTGTASAGMGVPLALDTDSAGRLWILSDPGDHPVPAVSDGIYILHRFDTPSSGSSRPVPDASTAINFFKLSGQSTSGATGTFAFAPALTVNADDTLTLGCYTGPTNIRVPSLGVDFPYVILKTGPPLGLPPVVDTGDQIAAVVKRAVTSGLIRHDQNPTGYQAMLARDRTGSGFWLADGVSQVSRYPAQPGQPAAERTVTGIYGPADNLSFYFRFPSVPGASYRLFSSVNLEQWVGGESRSATGPETVFTVPLTEKNMFYRAVIQP